MRKPILSLVVLAALVLPLPASASGSAGPQELLYSLEGNRLRRLDLDTLATEDVLEDVLIERASAGETGSTPGGRGRDVNGMLCTFPDGTGRFVAGEDTGQPHPPAGWGVFDRLGRQLGRLTATYLAGGPEPFGCAFLPGGRLVTTEVGDPGFGANNGQLILWFPPLDQYPGALGAFPDTDAASANFCKLATNLGTASGVAVDRLGRIWVATSSGLAVHRFSPPFPTAPTRSGGCGARDPLGSPMATVVNRAPVIGPDQELRMFTFSGIANAPNGNLYVASVLTGRIAEYDLDGRLVRFVVDHDLALFALPTPFGNPQGLAVGRDGTLYYADLDLVGEFPDLGPGPNGKVWRVRFDAQGEPQEPEIVREGLAFPDGVAVLPGNLETKEWPTYAGGPERQFFNHDEQTLSRRDVAQLAERWRFPTGAIVTASPAVAQVDLPNEGPTRVVFLQSWDDFVYALRLDDGSEVWRFATDPHPGASFPNASSVDVAEVEGRLQVHVGAGEILYAIDAASGRELWRFTAGTGCVGPLHGRRAVRNFDPEHFVASGAQGPPGLCAHDGERNEIESSPITAEGLVLFGMDVDDSPLGKGGFYAVRAGDGRLAWFFDLETGKTCRPFARDEVRFFDPYHSAKELALHPRFFSTRPGCDFPRRPTGCGNVWSSPAYDAGRGAVYVASSNCDTDLDPATAEPPPPMPPYDEAIFALRVADGRPLWRWRPREVDNDDLAYGAVPNLFRLRDGAREIEVVGVGNKDGSYVVIDRDGVNERTGVAWDDPDPSGLPYWIRRVVPGGSLGGLPSTASVDEVRRRITFGTAPGEPSNAPPFGVPQQPTLHALDMDSGAVVWQQGGDANFAPTSGIPGVTFFGSVFPGILRARRTDDDSGAVLANLVLPALGLATGSVVIDGTLVTGGGIGQRTGNPEDPQELVSHLPVPITAWCVPGAVGCPIHVCSDGRDNDADGRADYTGAGTLAADAGCVSAEDDSEVHGDVDFDGDRDNGDIVRINLLQGLERDDPGFLDAADLDRDGVIDADDRALWFVPVVAPLPLPPPPRIPSGSYQEPDLGYETLTTPSGRGAGLGARRARASSQSSGSR
jgi:outer membrane protein assembly factor BamB